MFSTPIHGLTHCLAGVVLTSSTGGFVVTFLPKRKSPGSLKMHCDNSISIGSRPDVDLERDLLQPRMIPDLVEQWNLSVRLGGVAINSESRVVSVAIARLQYRILQYCLARMLHA
eukprot:s404_g29.t1